MTDRRRWPSIPIRIASSSCRAARRSTRSSAPTGGWPRSTTPTPPGEAALPRFLAIQAAYEQLLDRRVARGAWPPGPRRAATSLGGRSGPERRDASCLRRTRAQCAAGGATAGGPARPSGRPARRREAGRRGRRAGRHGPATAGGAAAGRGRRRRSRARRTARSRPGGLASRAGTPRTPDPGTARVRRERPEPDAAVAEDEANKATLGSTSYDGADAEAFEPDWRGASWYGTTSGTYWTLNPKEYADPRKHGPEYQARAGERCGPGRPRSARPTPRGGTGGSAGSTGAARRRCRTRSARSGPATARRRQRTDRDPAAGPTHTTSSWWDSTAGAGWRPRVTRARRTRTASPRAGPWVRRPASRRRRRAADPTSVGRGRRHRPRCSSMSGWWGPRTGRSRHHRLAPDRLRHRLVHRRADRLRSIRGDLRRLSRAAVPWGSRSRILALLLVVAGPGRDRDDGRACRCSWPRSSAALTLSATGAAADEALAPATLGAVLLVAWMVGLVLAVARRVRPPRPRPVPYPDAMPRRHDQRDLSSAAQEYLLALRVMAGDGRRGSRHGGPDRPPSRGHDTGRQRDVPAAGRGRPGRPRRWSRPAPDGGRSGCRRRDLPPPRPAGVAADLGHRPRLGRIG